MQRAVQVQPLRVLCKLHAHQLQHPLDGPWVSSACMATRAPLHAKVSCRTHELACPAAPGSVRAHASHSALASRKPSRRKTFWLSVFQL